jgi:hypothetical protein
VDVEASPNRYEWLQVLLAVLLFCVNFVLFGIVLVGGVHIGLGVGVLELVVSRKMSGRSTFRATEAPTSARSALGGLGPWLLGFGVFNVIFSVGYVVLAYIVNYYA